MNASRARSHFSGDENVRRIVALAEGADLLFIEGGFLTADAAEAARRRHLTASQAGSIARMAGVKRLHTLHYSPRYKVAAEAEAPFRLTGRGAWVTRCQPACSPQVPPPSRSRSMR
jgi:ribonuclease BN (tRNA processing enzyme)